MLKKIFGFIITVPRRNEWSLTKDFKYEYKAIRIDKFSKKRIVRLRIIFFIKPNRYVPKDTNQYYPDLKIKYSFNLNLGFISCTIFPLKEYQNNVSK